MKLVFVLVVLTAAFMANCRDISDGQPVLQAFAPEEEVTLDNDLTEDEQYIQNGLEEVKEHSGTEQRGKKDKKVMKQLVDKLADIKIDLQTLKKHQDNITNTNGEQKVDLKIIKEQQQNITNSNKDLKIELQNIGAHQVNVTNSNKDLKVDLGNVLDHQVNITNSNKDLKVELKNVLDHQVNITNTNKDFKVELENIEDHQVNITNTNKDIKDKLESVVKNITASNSQLQTDVSSILSMLTSIVHQGCQGTGVFLLGGQCFKAMRDKERTWQDAKTKCESEHMILAEPTDTNALPLRKYLVTKYGDSELWVGARGDGSKIVFQRSKRYLLKTSTLLDNCRGQSCAVSTSNCLELDVYKTVLSGGTAKYPYDAGISCTTNHWPLCEVL